MHPKDVIRSYAVLFVSGDSGVGGPSSYCYQDVAGRHSVLLALSVCEEDRVVGLKSGEAIVVLDSFGTELLHVSKVERADMVVDRFDHFLPAVSWLVGNDPTCLDLVVVGLSQEA